MTVLSQNMMLESIEGLSGLQNEQISTVVLNGNRIDVTGLPSFGFGEVGNVAVRDFLGYVSENADESSAGEFLGVLSATVVDNCLYISPRNVGSKG